MKSHIAQGAVLGFAFAVAASAFSGSAFGVDEEAAKALMKKNDCTKCHAADKDKVGPSFKKVATKYKGKADAEQLVATFITTGPKVKMTDGSEYVHKTIDTKDPKDLKNVAQWILAQ